MWAYGEAHPEAGAWEDGFGLVEDVAQGLGGAGSMRRAERRQCDGQLAIGDGNVAGSGEELMQEGSALLLGAQVVRPQQREQIALGLIGDHLDDVGQVLAFCGELDDGVLVEVAHFDELGNVAAVLDEPRQTSVRGSQLGGEAAMGELEAAHGRAALPGMV